MTDQCAWCTAPFKRRRRRQQYCSHDCARAARWDRDRTPAAELVRNCSTCGAEFAVRYQSSRQVFCSRSCGSKPHANRPDSTNSNWRGGKTQHELYHVYNDMLGRCRRPTHHGYANYGGRGIYVCQRWIDDFWNFVDDMGPRPPGLSIDRVNNDGPYSPDNCRWATAKQQRANRRPQRRRMPRTTDHGERVPA